MDDERCDAGAGDERCDVGAGGGTDTVSWRDLLEETRGRLAAGPVEVGPEEARWIVEEVTGLAAADLLRSLDSPATVRGVARLDALVARRLAGEPLQYVLGHWPFRALDLLVDARVLIPRPETEGVVDAALAALARGGGGSAVDGAPALGGAPVVVDLGTGSGAIGLSLAWEVPAADVWLVERAPGAAAVARANLVALGRAGRRVRLVEGSWFEPLPDALRGGVDLVVSNPPYVAADEALPDVVEDWEPGEALVSGPTGLEAIELIVAAAPTWLRPGGALVVEIGETQGPAVLALAAAADLTDAVIHLDLAGRPRTLVAHLPR